MIICSGSGIGLYRGIVDLVYKRIEPYLCDYMGKVFEEICKQYLWKLLLIGEAPVEFKDLGHWWGTDPATHSQTEIDIMGEEDKDTALFGECKWTNENIDTGVLETLTKRCQIFHYRKKRIYGWLCGSCQEGRKRDTGAVQGSFKETYVRLEIIPFYLFVVFRCAVIGNQS